MKFKEIYLSLGSNIGELKSNLEEALKRLKEKVKIVKVSSLYKTGAVEYEEQSDFLNIILKGKTDLKSLELLDFLKKIEKEMGRKKVINKGPRIIDIDIIFYEQEVLENERLYLPHKEYLNRLFVLQPLLEIEMNIKDPKKNKEVQEIYKEKKEELLKQRIKKLEKKLKF